MSEVLPRVGELLTADDIERLANERGLTMAAVSRISGVSPSIFIRWKQGRTEPTLVNYRRIRDAILALPVAEPPCVIGQGNRPRIAARPYQFSNGDGRTFRYSGRRSPS